MNFVCASLIERNTMTKSPLSNQVLKLRSLVTLIFLLTAQAVVGQTKLYFEITDLSSKVPLEGVTVSLTKRNRPVVLGKTDANGQFNTTLNETGKIMVSCSYPNYVSFDRTFEIDSDSLFFSFSMKAVKVQDVREVVVKAPGVADTVYGSSRLSVEDFEVLDNGDLILLTYPKRLSKGSEIVLWNGSRAVNSFPVPGMADHLEKDFRGNVQVICKDRVFTVIADGKNLEIAQLEKDYYYRYVAPILDTNGQELYYTDFNKDYPEFSFWKYDQVDSTYDKFRTIRDDLMMELYRSEYKWVDVRTKIWAKNLEYETGIDAEIWVGANYFTQSVYYKELYAPFFKTKDQLVVFDYYTDRMYRHNLEGEISDSVDIGHHLNKKKTGWKNHLIQDKETGNVYAWFEKAGTSFLGRIDLVTGEINELKQLNFKYLHKIEVHNNFVYYVYRPFESPQKKFLYREKLPLSFTSVD